MKLPGCSSLKEKRSRIKPLISRLHREFNVSVAEIDFHDSWRDTVIACALVSNNHDHTRQALQVIPAWVAKYWQDLELVDDHIELIN
ncbi:MAG: DUF503 domain-containing protein [Anaerolineales bacterium]|nr:DUF503 domain-containing protein [Anaerolineales bacterium]